MKFKDRDERIIVTEDIFQEVIHTIYEIPLKRWIEDTGYTEGQIYSAIEKMIAVHLDTWDERL